MDQINEQYSKSNEYGCHNKHQENQLLGSEGGSVFIVIVVALLSLRVSAKSKYVTATVRAVLGTGQTHWVPIKHRLVKINNLNPI